LAHETGVRRTADPLGGSYYVEWLTTQIEEGIIEYLDQIEKEGGCLAILESGWLESELTASSYRKQQEIEKGERPLVGVNFLRAEGEAKPESVRAFALRPGAEAEQIKDLQQVRSQRNSGDVDAALRHLRSAAEGSENTIPSLLEAVRAYVSIGEMCGVLKEVWGEVGPRSWEV
jgi:methylmalonyl-CoA mutase N-terminal domain/subunit